MKAPLIAKLSKALAAPDPLAKLIEEPAPGIFVFDAFTRPFCKALSKDLERFQGHAPNTMNRYGCILKDVGYGALCESLLHDLVTPLARRFYPGIGHLSSYHGFIVNYSSKQRHLDRHVDSSDVTLNISLGGEFTGGRLVFEHEDTGEVIVKLDQIEGRAVMHPGTYAHRAQNIRSGSRSNLILWCRK